MFGRKDALEALEKQVWKLYERVHDLEESVKEKTSILEHQLAGPPKPAPIHEVVEMILRRIGLEVRHVDAQPETVELRETTSYSYPSLEFGAEKVPEKKKAGRK